MGFKKSQGRYYESYADAIERGAKEKNDVALAEKAATDAYKAWAETNKMAILSTPGLADRKMQEIRLGMYKRFGIENTMATGAPAPAGGYSVVGSRPS
jgi:hypothetical protein